MIEDSPHGAQRLAEALAILRASATKRDIPKFLVEAIGNRDFFDAAIDSAIETCGVSIDDADRALALLNEHHRVPPPVLTGMPSIALAGFLGYEEIPLWDSKR